MRKVVILAFIAVLSAQQLYADDWIIGLLDPNESITLTTDRVVDGNIIIANNGYLSVENGARLTVTKGIWMLNTSVMEVTSASLYFQQSFSYQGQAIVSDNARLTCTDSIIDGSGHSFSIGVGGQAQVQWTNITVQNGFPTWGLLDQATVSVDGCVTAGEFLCLGTNQLDISNSDLVLLWLTLPDGSVVDVTLPPSGYVASWSVSPNSTWATGIPYTANITNCTNVWWAVMARSGCNGTFRDSSLRVVGSYFERANTVEVTGVANNQFQNDSSYAWGDVSLRFINSSVETWNFYSYGTTDLTLRSCLFGELLVAETGKGWVENSLCDGTGGYIGVFEDGFLVFARSTNLAQTTSRGNGILVSWGSALLNAQIDATDDSILQLVNTEYFGEPEAIDAAVIFDAAIDPVEGAVTDQIPLRGSARMITGPTSPWQFSSYSLDYGLGTNPTSWNPIGSNWTNQVRDNILTTWNTTGIDPGDYSVQLSIHHSLGSVLTVASSASLSPGPCPTDFNGDNAVDVLDFFLFVSLFAASDSSADLNNDAVVDVLDFFLFVNLFDAGCP